MQKIWRYMDLWKFENLLESSSLFFAAAATQQDKLETIAPVYSKYLGTRIFGRLESVHQSSLLHNYEVMEMVQSHALMLSCWHMNDAENPRMWTDYISTTGEGVAIWTSIDSLRASFAAFSHPLMIHFGSVEYIERHVSRKHYYGIAKSFQKQVGYAWESEFRAVLDTMEVATPFGKRNWQYSWSKPGYAIGVLVPVQLDTLIAGIVLSPHASADLKNVVRELCLKHGLVKSIEASKV